MVSVSSFIFCTNVWADNNSNSRSASGLVYDGLNYYDSISAALDENNSLKVSIILLGNDTVDTSFTIAKDRNITIDLNGNELKVGTTNGVGITNNGNLKIYDTVGGGSIISYGSVSMNADYTASIHTICIDNYSTLTLDNINISSNAYVYSYGNSAFLSYRFLYNHENSSAKIENVTITGTHSVGLKKSETFPSALMDDYFCYSEAACVDINNMDYSMYNGSVVKTKNKVFYNELICM
jgi:hypothetical protein